MNFVTYPKFFTNLYTISGQKFWLLPPPHNPTKNHVKPYFLECLKHKGC